MGKRVWLLVLLIFSAELCAFGAQVVDVHFEGESQATSSSQAKSEISKKAIEESSLKYISSMIGEEKTQRNMAIIQAKIIGNSGKYVLLTKNGTLKSFEKGFRMPVQMKFSLDNLKGLLLSQGLLYKFDGPPKVLPLVRVSDRVSSKSLTWWMGGDETDSFSQGILANLHENLKDELFEAGFFGYLPISFSMSGLIPEVFQKDNLRKEDFLNLGFVLGGSVVVLGEVKISDLTKSVGIYKIDLSLEALHTGSGRVVGEVIRSYETTMGSYQSVVKKKFKEEVAQFSKDLASQLREAWKKGVFDASLLKLSLHGKFNYQQTTALKKSIEGLSQVKSLRERMFSRDMLVFEVDSSAGVDELAKVLVGSSIAGARFEVDDIQNYGLSLKIKGWE